MTAGFPVRSLSGNCLALILASAFLVPSVLLFCAVHKAADKRPTVLATGLVIVCKLADDLIPPGTVSSGDPNAGNLSPCAVMTQNTVPNPYYSAKGCTNLVQQQAEQNTPAVAQNVEQQLWPDFGAYNDTYDGLSAFGGDDIISCLLSNFGEYVARIFQEMPLQACLTLSGFLLLWTAGPVVLSKL
jgi:hypothetical protein